MQARTLGNLNVKPAESAAITKPLAWYWRIGWWTAFVGIVVMCVILSFTGYRHGLPFADTQDEVTLWTMGRAYIDPAWNLFQPSQPPATLKVAEIVQRFQIAFGDPYYNVSGFVEVMRLLSLIFNLISLVLIVVLARRLAGPLAGLAAGVFWAALPMANDLAKLAGHNMFMTAFFVAAVAVGIEGYTRKSLGWIVFSLILAMLSTVFKWQGAAALAMPGLACLTFWNSDRRKMILSMIGYGIIVGLFSLCVVFVFHALDGDTYLPGVKPTRPTVGIVATNFVHMLLDVAPVLIFAVLPLIAFVIAAAVPALRRRFYAQMAVWGVVVVLLAFAFILSFQGAPVFDRHYLAGLALLAVLAGVGLSFLIQIILQIGQRWRWASYVVVGALLLVIAAPVVQMANQSYAANQPLLKPDRRNVFAEWARSTAVEGPLLVTDPGLAIAVQTLHGYRGRPIETPYNIDYALIIKPEQIDAHALTVANIRYLITMPDHDTSDLKLPMTKLVYHNVQDGNFTGPEWEAWYVGALPKVAAAPLATFGGEVALRGYSLSRQNVCPGESVDLQMLWSAPKTPTRYYSAYVHLSSEKTRELSEPINGDPLAIGDRPTITWTMPGELLVGPRRTFQIRPDLPPGNYQLWLGVFEPLANQRLTLPDGTDHYVMASLNVRDCSALPIF